MAHLPNRGSPNVFVGNIPYDQTEEQLSDLFSQAGRVVDFRLVMDQETGKPKGYGFCQFEDAETAASALRNMNGVELGGRSLRLDYGNKDPRAERSGGGPGGRSHASASRGFASGDAPSRWGAAAPAYPAPPPAAALPAHAQAPPSPYDAAQSVPPPASAPAAPSSAVSETIRTTLSHMPLDQLLDILSQMRTFSCESPDEARTVLLSHPQLAHALFQAMLMMNLVDPVLLQQLRSAVSAPLPSHPIQAAQPAGVTPMAPGLAPTHPAPTPHQGYAAPAAGYPGYPPPGFASGPAHAPPPAPASVPAAAPAPAVDIPEEQRALLQQVMSIPQDQIDALDAEQRATLMALRQQYSGLV